MTERGNAIYIIGEDHTNVAGLTLLRQRSHATAPGQPVMVELFASLNGVIQAHQDNKISSKDLEKVLSAYSSSPELNKRVPQLLEMLEDFKATRTPVIAYDIRSTVAANEAGMEPKAAFISWRSQAIEQRAAEGAPKAELERDQFYVDTVAKYWNYSKITKPLEETVRNSRAEGVTNPDLIAARVIDRFSGNITHVLAGSDHIDGQDKPQKRAHGILDDALRAMGHRVHLTIAADHAGELMNAVLNCRTSEKIDTYLIVDPQTKRAREAFYNNASLEKALAQVAQQFEQYQFRSPNSHYGACAEGRYPVANQDPEYGPALQRLQQVHDKSKSR